MARIELTSANDSYVGDSIKDIVYGKEGNDTISGGDDSDSLYGEDGDDLLLGESGNDRLYGSKGNDTLIGGSNTGTNSWHRDSLLGYHGDDVLVGGIVLENGEVVDDNQPDFLNGQDGNDILVGGNGDRLSGSGLAHVPNDDRYVVQLSTDSTTEILYYSLGEDITLLGENVSVAAITQTRFHSLKTYEIDLTSDAGNSALTVRSFADLTDTDFLENIDTDTSFTI